MFVTHPHPIKPLRREGHQWPFDAVACCCSRFSADVLLEVCFKQGKMRGWCKRTWLNNAARLGMVSVLDEPHFSFVDPVRCDIRVVVVGWLKLKYEAFYLPHCVLARTTRLKPCGTGHEPALMRSKINWTRARTPSRALADSVKW